MLGGREGRTQAGDDSEVKSGDGGWEGQGDVGSYS